MKKTTVAVLVALALTGCEPHRTELERCMDAVNDAELCIEREKARYESQARPESVTYIDDDVYEDDDYDDDDHSSSSSVFIMGGFGGGSAPASNLQSNHMQSNLSNGSYKSSVKSAGYVDPSKTNVPALSNNPPAKPVAPAGNNTLRGGFGKVATAKPAVAPKPVVTKKPETKPAAKQSNNNGNNSNKNSWSSGNSRPVSRGGFGGGRVGGGGG